MKVTKQAETGFRRRDTFALTFTFPFGAAIPDYAGRRMDRRRGPV